MSQHCEATTQDVMKRLQALYEAYSRQDLDTVMSFFAPDPDVVVIGTAEDERVVGIEAIRTSWKHSTDEPVNLQISTDWHSVTCRESIAWFSVQLHYAVSIDKDSTVHLATRASGVMEKRGQDWLICQYHASHPTPSLFSSYTLSGNPILPED